ncbi:hypothetical protein C4D60_Mb03t21930 [Musa balbisiana]|uniref:Uncharacterized protein n=1 Tax=Musa balbisiana TaxID=52838 RepID=A0A4S8JBL9_MUSBA|nr:hypothetical protein C4D60_Mb03t21930 [Musa balbisiana]
MLHATRVPEIEALLGGSPPAVVPVGVARGANLAPNPLSDVVFAAQFPASVLLPPPTLPQLIARLRPSFIQWRIRSRFLTVFKAKGLVLARGGDCHCFLPPGTATGTRLALARNGRGSTEGEGEVYLWAFRSEVLLAFEEILALTEILAEEIGAEIGVDLHLGETKIGNLGLEIEAEEHIAGLDVTVDDRGIALEVEEGESLGHVEDDGEAAVPVERGAGAEEGFLEAPVGHVLVDEEAAALALEAVAEEGDDEGGGSEGGEDVELVVELAVGGGGAGGGGRTGGGGGEEALDGDGLAVG